MLDRAQPTDTRDLGMGDNSLAARMRDLCEVLTRDAPRADEAGVVTPAAWNALAVSALLRAPFPRRLGGEDLGSAGRHAELVVALRHLGAADLPVARLVEGHINAVLLVRRYGTEAQLKAFAGSIEAGGVSGVWGAEGAEPLRAQRTTAGWDLTGGKILASGAGILTDPLVPVATPDGQVLMMPKLSPGERADLSGWTAQGMHASATGSIDLTGLAVPDDRVIGEPGDFTRQPVFSGGAWRFCAAHLGAAERLVDLLRHHLTARGRDRDPYQLQRVAQATAAVTTARFWVREAARLLAEETAPPDTIVAFANLTRTVTERAALDVLEAVHRSVGLGGFMRPHPIERISRDLATYLRQPVPDLAMADAARAILASPRSTAELWTDA